jgi:hypothetical protein
VNIAKAEESDLDIDALFDNAEDTEIVDNDKGENVLTSFLKLFNPGFGLYADYSIIASYLPGYSKSPWQESFRGKEIFDSSQPFGAEMNAYLGLDIRLSPVLRFWQSAKFSIPGMTMKLYEFYGEYNFLNQAYVKIGKYNYGWGLSPNFPYTNLLIRLPLDSPDPGDLYLAKVDIPIGTGGLQTIAFTRERYIDAVNPQLKQFSFGGKFNFASRYADIDIGSLYFKEMPWRTFFSLKTTVFKSTELYAEALIAIRHETMDDARFSGSIGFYQDFFDKKIRLNMEIFYNGEFDGAFYRQENPLEDTKKKYPFLQGTNTAFNLDYKPGGLAQLRVGTKFLYNIDENSGEIIPGISIEPAQHLKLYFAMPFVVGNPNGKYYTANSDKYNRAFSFVFILSISGGFSFIRY